MEHSIEHEDDGAKGAFMCNGPTIAWRGTRVVALCPFAKAQFDKDASIRDVWA